MAATTPAPCYFHLVHDAPDSKGEEATPAVMRVARGALPHLGVLLLLTLIILPALLLKPYFHHHGEDTIVVADIVFGGNPWRVMEVAVFNWLGLSLFHEWWQGIGFLSALLSVSVAFSIYLLWLELAHLLPTHVRAATGGHAPGLLAAYGTALMNNRYITDITGVSYRLAALFGLLTLVLSLRYHRTARWPWWAAAMLAYLLSGLSHSFTWPLGLLILLLEMTRRRRDPATGAPRPLLRYFLMALVPVGILIGSTAYMQLMQFLSGDMPGPRNPSGGPAAFLLGRYIYMVVTATVIHPVFANLSHSPGAAEWAVDALLVLVMAVGLARLWRGRGLDLLGLITLFVLLWFVLTILPLLVSAVEWQAGVYRFTYPMLGPILVASYLAIRLLALAARLLPRAWQGPRLMAGVAGCIIVVHLPFGPTGAGLARAVESGRYGLHQPCPGQATCAAIKELDAEAVKQLGQGAALNCTDLSLADLSGVDLGAADLRRANLSGVRLLKTGLAGARLQESCAYWGDMRDLKLPRANLKGARFIGCFMNRVDLTGADMREVSLRSGHLQRATLPRANLSKADLVRTSFAEADLRGAILRGANLTGGDLAQTDFRGADLRGANLTKANLVGARFDGANLHGALACDDSADEIIRSGVATGTIRTIQCGSEPPEASLRPPWY